MVMRRTDFRTAPHNQYSYSKRNKEGISSLSCCLCRFFVRTYSVALDAWGLMVLGATCVFAPVIGTRWILAPTCCNLASSLS
jgi:hypothetical protein